MTYRRAFLAIAAVFIGYLLWLVIVKDSAVAMAAVWPLIVAFIVILMLPEKRLGGELFVRVMEAWKGKKDD